MSLFKIFRGTKQDLDDKVKEKHDGYAYYLTDKSNLLIDYGTERKKVIGLSQKSEQFDLNFTSNTYTVTNPFFIDDQPNEMYSYIIAPLEESFDIYTECGVRASSISNGSMNFSCKEIPTKIIKVSILRVEEDPYA